MCERSFSRVFVCLVRLFYLFSLCAEGLRGLVMREEWGGWRTRILRWGSHITEPYSSIGQTRLLFCINLLVHEWSSICRTIFK